MHRCAVVEMTSGSLGGLVNEQRISELPLNARNFNDLVLLQTGIKVLVSTKWLPLLVNALI
jgi:hypothetical protein